MMLSPERIIGAPAPENGRRVKVRSSSKSSENDSAPPGDENTPSTANKKKPSPETLSHLIFKNQKGFGGSTTKTNAVFEGFKGSNGTVQPSPEASSRVAYLSKSENVEEEEKKAAAHAVASKANMAASAASIDSGSASTSNKKMMMQPCPEMTTANRIHKEAESRDDDDTASLKEEDPNNKVSSYCDIIGVKNLAVLKILKQVDTMTFSTCSLEELD